MSGMRALPGRLGNPHGIAAESVRGGDATLTRVGANLINQPPETSLSTARAAVMDNVRIGVIGLGNMGAHHASYMDALDGGTLAAVCDANPAAIDRVAQKFP